MRARPSPRPTRSGGWGGTVDRPIFLRDDAYAARRRALELHLRRTPRRARPPRTPRLGFWQRPVGALAAVLLVATYCIALFLMLLTTSSGPGGTP